MKLIKKVNDYKYVQAGVDIGSFSIKVAALKKKPLSKEETLTYSIEHIPKDATLQQKVDLIHKCLKEAGITTSKVNTSVSGPNVICRYSLMPFMHRDDLVRSLELEWDKYMSLKIDEVIWDCVLLDTLKDSTGRKKIQILIVAAKKNLIKERLQLLEAAGLEVQTIDADAFALIKAFRSSRYFESQQTVVLLNIGEYFTNIVVLRRGICWFSRDILLGGRDLTQIIVEKLHLAWPEAEQLKRNLDGSNPKNLQLVRTILDNLVNELNISFEYLKRELAEPIECIYISGGSSNLFELDKFLSENLNITIKKWNPASAFKLKPGLSQEAFEKDAPDLVVAIGLALIKK